MMKEGKAHRKQFNLCSVSDCSPDLQQWNCISGVVIAVSQLSVACITSPQTEKQYAMSMFNKYKAALWSQISG